MNTTEPIILNTVNNTTMNSHRLFVFVLGLTISFLSFVPVFGQNPFIPKYDAVKRSERCFTVTWETNNQFGAVWWADKVDFASDTAFNFVVYMGDRDGNGADGLAFVMHQDPRDTLVDPSKQVIIGGAGTWDLEAATGDDGGGLGYAKHDSRVGPNTIPGPHGPGDSPENHKIQKSVAVELDTWNNSDVPDGNNGNDGNGTSQTKSKYYGWDHTSVVYNGDIYGQQQVITDALGETGRILPLKPAYAFGAGNNPDGSAHHNIEDDRCYLFQIRWETNPDGTQSIELWADVYNGTTNTDGLQLIMTHTDDMLNKVFGGNSIMRFGFTGSTGGSINEQTICLLGENLQPFAQDDYASIPMNTQTEIDVESNDNDPDGDELHVPIIVVPAHFGSSVIFEKSGVNYMRYNPNTNFVGLDSVAYVTCDVNSTKCYAKCDTAWVFINVGCIPFDVSVNMISPNTLCDTSFPQNGAAEAQVSGGIFGIFWSENFDGLPDGTKSTPKWTMDDSNANYDNVPADHAEVRNKKISISDIGGHGSGKSVTLSTEEIDISGKSNVSITVDLIASKNMEGGTNEDYINVFYKIDGGPEVALADGLHKGGNFTAKASVSGLSGNKVQVIVRALNSSNNEYYFVDNIMVGAAGTGTANVSYNWYKGSVANGTPDFTGQIYNNMHSGEYTVIAKDLNSGCLSSPQTVTIDSTSFKPVGGYIKPRAPFTSCKLPDGQLEAGVFNGTDSVHVGYLFEWYVQENPSDIIQTGHIAKGLKAREYTVRITDLGTGCDTTINKEVTNTVTLPLVTANKISDITSCSDPNSGVGNADVSGITAGYSFEWYKGPSIGAGLPDFTGSSISTFPEGMFTVQAIDEVTLCKSDPANITILDVTTTPVLDIDVISQQISCDPLAPMGELSGTVDVSGIPTTTGYTFNWFKGKNNLPANRISTSNIATGLAAGTYRLIVTEDATNCTSLHDTLVVENTTNPPAITVAKTNVTSCDSPNGTITVSVAAGENVADYIFELYKGNGATGTPFQSSTSPLFENLIAGDYTLVGKNSVTKCATAPVTTNVKNAKVKPVATIDSQDQISCDPSAFTGQLTVASVVVGLISDYSYEWFNESLTGTPISSSSPDGEIITGLDSGNYALRITNNTTQCNSTYFPTVNIAQVFPVEVVSSTPSTFCAPNGNGELHASVQGVTAPFSGYSFRWESVASGNILSNNPDISGVAPGDYLLTIQDNTTKCVSNTAPITVADNSVIPSPVLDLTDNSSCDPTNPNGQIEVIGTNESPTYDLTDYTYAWFDNAAPLVALGSTSEILGSLDNGTYKLLIQNTITSCSNSVLSEISDINIKPVIDAVTVTHATDCSEPYMSGAAITFVNGGQPVPAGYTFVWTNKAGVPAIAGNGSAIADIDGTDEILPPGDYEVIAYNAYNCPSDPVSFTIKDNSTDPVFTIDATPNSSCAWMPSNTSTYANGTLNVNYIGPNTITDYTWERESPSSPGVWTAFGGNTAKVDGLHELDRYRVQVIDDHKCSTTNYSNINKVTDANPVIELVSTTDVTNCNVYDGELEVQLTLGDPTPVGFGYDYILTGPVNTNQVDNGVFQNLLDGKYGIYTVNTFTQCQSDPIEAELIVDHDLIFTINPTAPANCSGALGVIDITSEAVNGTNEFVSAPNTGIGNGFTYSWFKGIDKTIPLPIADISQPNNWSSEVINLLSGYYTVEITDLNSSCSLDTNVYLPTNSLPVFSTATTTDSRQCVPGDGIVQLEIDPTTFGTIGMSTADYSHYEYILFKGNVVDPLWAAPGDPGQIDYIAEGGVAAVGPVEFTGLEPGTYTVIARQGTAFLEPCLSVPKTFTIDLDYTFAPLTFNEIKPDNTCVTLNGNGQLEETPNPFYTTGGKFVYTWYKGTDTSASGIVVEGPTNVTKQTPDTLRAGQYTLVIEVVGVAPLTGLGCKTSGVTNLSKQIDKLTVANAPNNPVTICSFGNGDIHITEIAENGVSLGDTTGYSHFKLYDNSLAEITTNAGTGEVGTPWNLLDKGNYYVTAQNSSTKCITDPYKVDIKDISENPVITASIITPDFSCNGISPTGVLEAWANGDQDESLYSYEWKNPTNVVVSDATPNSFRATGLSANNSQETYSIIVQDIFVDNINDGCVSTRDFTLVHQPTSVYVLSAVPQPQTNCAPNGEIQILTIREKDNVAATDYGAPFTNPPLSQEFNAELLNENLTLFSPKYSFDKATGSFVDMTNDIDSIPAGTYYLRGQNISNGCPFGPATQVIIKDVSKKPIISATLDSPDYACAGGTPTGQLSPTAIGGTDGDVITTNFTFNWTLKSTGANASGGVIASGLSPDVYTLTVQDVTNADRFCISTRDYVVPVGRHAIAMTASGTNQTICDPDGTIQVDNVSVDGGANIVNPHLVWTAQLLDQDKNTLTPVPPNSGFASDQPFINIAAGTYYTRVQDNSTKCYSSPYQVVLEDVSTNPVVTNVMVDQPQYSLNPNNASWTGMLTGSVAEADGTFNAGDYSYEWFKNISTDPANSLNTQTPGINMLDSGNYTLYVKNNVTGCETSYSKFLPFQYLEPTFNTIISAKTVCSPNDGDIAVSDIALDGTADDLMDYQFSFYNESYASGDVADHIVNGSSVVEYNGINDGAYYIVAKENWWMIESYPVQVEVIDSTTNPLIVFNPANYQALTSCDASVFANGTLGVDVYEENAPGGNYQYAWYNGNKVDNAQLIPNSDNKTITGLPAGEFTLHVVNLDNNCEADKTFSILDRSVIPEIEADMSPNTNCPVDMGNGIVTVRVLNSTEKFEYLWYAGNTPKATPDYSASNTWSNRPVGEYAVVAVDSKFGTCKSTPAVIMVEDATVRPKIKVSEIHPITNCDPENANAVVSASADGGVSNYTFEWFTNDQLYYTGPVASNLGNNIYKVVVTNNATQCQADKSVVPTILLDIVPPPDVEILSDLTSCISPDGKATATVQGNIKDYIFSYIRKYDNSPVDNLFQDNIMHDMDTSTYLVTAKHRVTGCISHPTEFAISNETYYPQIDIITDPSNCQDPSGSANVIISDQTRDYKVTWYGENGYEEQLKEIGYLPVGKYRVEVEGTDGCITPAEAEVKGDVIIYNGVSANNDGYNDFFAIVCLEYFPENNVKVYNRAGMLVYEQSFYDMNDPSRRFEGLSNKGAAVMGKDLPIGTYFYVVDKNDGSKPKVGYLELNR